MNSRHEILRIGYLTLALSLSGCSSTPIGASRTVLVEGARISYVEDPGAGPTVVFESGLGDGLAVWKHVYRGVRQFAHVFAYSRPGYPPSPPRLIFGGQRTARESARLLHELLATSKVRGPYILVGHSIGGLYVLEFARHYPDLVAGLVLVDGRVPGFTEKCELADVGMCRPPKLLTVLSPPHVAAEIRGIPPSEAQAPSAADIDDIPATLIAATKPALGGSRELQPIWLAVQQQFADALSNGRLVIAEGSGHYIQKDAPHLVIEQIRQMVLTTRGK